MAGRSRQWFLHHNTRGAHFDNYPGERWLGTSPARHPYRDTVLELHDIAGRLWHSLEATGQLEDTVIIVSSDSGRTWRTGPTPGTRRSVAPRGARGMGGVRVPAVVVWPGVIEPGQVDDGLLSFTDLRPTAVGLAGIPDAVPDDRFIDGVLTRKLASVDAFGSAVRAHVRTFHPPRNVVGLGP